MKIGIVVVGYNRVNSLARLLSSLNRAYYDDDKIILIISLDKSDNQEVKLLSEHFQWEHGDKKIILHSENLGLRKHILSCGNLLNDFDALVILEDDVFVAPSFYLYAKSAVCFYHSDNNIAGISLYSFGINYQARLPFIPEKSEADVYLMSCAQSWGQVWMKEQWMDFMEWYKKCKMNFGRMDHLPNAICDWPQSSWLKYHTRYCIEQKKYFVYPYHSYSTNCNDAGVHEQDGNTFFQVALQMGKVNSFHFVELAKAPVVYDGFFERMYLGRVLGVLDDELCVNFYGEKNDSPKRYLLSTKFFPFQVMKSYDLKLKPYELNIKEDINGFGLFLYDTNITCTPNKEAETDVVQYLWGYLTLYPFVHSIKFKMFLRLNFSYIRHLLYRIMRS